MAEHPRPQPPLTDEIRDVARRRPGGWVYAVDPAFTDEGSAPRTGIVGAWRVDGLGRITGEFRHNADYVPSAGTLDLPTPTDPLDDLLHHAAYKLADETAVLAAVLDSDLLLRVGQHPGLLSVADGRGGWVVHAFTSQSQADAADQDALGEHPPEDLRGWQRRSGRDLAAAWPLGHDLVLNPASAASLRLSGAALRNSVSGG
ncbi:MAG: type VII secretion system-associated protein [Sporichthyaceae bacterium]